ncbi:MAG: enoyl-CoA hydratase/isomerase family protein [Chloroflexi bacterium]|nr:enoyl-CoA hydratase/isomerase family protein [Chloroflexota bacterium]
MPYENLRVDRPAPGVGRVTLARPEKMNPMFRQTAIELQGALDELGADESVVCVILASTGKAFVGGADLGVLASIPDVFGMREYITLLWETFRKVELLPQPVIAAVNGFAFGAGMELVSACDFAIASDTARFAMPEPDLGLPSVIQAALFPKYASLGRIREWLYTADEIDAVEAERWGLVNRVVPLAELEAESIKVASKIAAKGSLAIRLQKELMATRWLRSDLETAMRDSVNFVALPFATGEPQRRAQRIRDQIRARKSGPGGSQT